MAVLGKFIRKMTRQWRGPFARNIKIMTVTVRDPDFKIIKVLTSDRDLAVFRELWSALTEVDRESWAPTGGREHYKIDIQWVRHSDRKWSNRWIYHRGGFINLVAILRAIWVAPLYRTPSPAEFEKMLRPDPE
jgi:hypothetical protein